MKKLKVYYAHPINLYNTPQEKRDIETLEALGFEVVNPNTDEHQKNYQAYKETVTYSFDYFINIVKQCDAVAFRSFIDFKISSGVGEEILVGKIVIELPTLLTERILTVYETKERLKELGQR